MSDGKTKNRKFSNEEKEERRRIREQKIRDFIRQNPVIIPERYYKTPYAAAYCDNTELTFCAWRTLGRGPKWKKIGVSVKYLGAELLA